MKIKVQLLCANDQDACSLYRGYGPFNKLHKHDKIDLVEREAMGWRYSSGVHAFVVQRPHTDVHINAIARAKDNGIPVIVDFDDDFTSVPLYNPAWKAMRATPNYIANCKKAVEYADVVWVSTEALKQRFLILCPELSSKKIQVIKNGWDWELWKCTTKQGAKNTFFWRGTASHDKDLWEITEALIDAIKLCGATGALVGVPRGSRGEDNRVWSVATMGHPFWMSVEAIADSDIDVSYNLAAPFHAMMTTMRAAQAKFGLVPLVDNPFNNCKSNIAALEMLASGMLPITAARDEFRLIPGLVCGDNYATSLAGAMDLSDADRHARWVQGVQWMGDEARLEDRNEERMQSILELVS